MAKIPKGNLYAEVRRLSRALEEAELKVFDLQQRVAQLESETPPIGSPFYATPIYPVVEIGGAPHHVRFSSIPDTLFTTCKKSSS